MTMTMNLPGILLLAVSLSLDAFGIGMTYGLRKIRIPCPARIIIGMMTFFFTGLSVLAGTGLSRILPAQVSAFIGVFLLLLLGINAIRSALFPKKVKEKPLHEKKVFHFFIKTWGISIQIIRDPESGDINHSNSIDPLEALYIGFALSIDSLGAGIAGAAIGFTGFLLPVLTALAQILFLSAGDLAGKKITGKTGKENRLFAALPGILLILLALFRLV